MASETRVIQVPASLYADLESLASDEQVEPVDLIARLVEAARQQRQAESPTRAFRRILERATDLGVTDLAEQRGFDPTALAVAWVGSHPAVTAPIIGARNLEQLEGSLKALEIEMTPELRAEISALSPEPPPATDRNEERTPINLGIR